jgi:predicted nuclease with RNAse H fold
VLQGGFGVVKRTFTRFLGVDLGGGRGKTSALAELRLGSEGAEVIEVATRAPQQPWTDESLTERLIAGRSGAPVVLAINAPLTAPACGRCVLPACPGSEVCEVPAVAWLRTTGRELVRDAAALAARGQARRPGAARGDGPARRDGGRAAPPPPIARLAPYSHRATDVVLAYGRGLLPIAALGAAAGAIAARAGHLRRRLARAGFAHHADLIEVSPAATIAALCGPRAARGYKRDADPWVTRASILERLPDLTFAPQSRMAREETLQNDHCFDAVIAAYTAYLWAREGWSLPEGCFAEDGWIVAPP